LYVCMLKLNLPVVFGIMVQLIPLNPPTVTTTIQYNTSLKIPTGWTYSGYQLINFFEYVLDRQQSGNPAIFIDNDCHVVVTGTKFFQ